MAGDDATVYLVGAGAVRDAWVPVVEAMNEVGFDDVVGADGANFAMAELVYLARFSCVRASAPVGRSRAEFVEKLEKTRSTIARALADAGANGTLRVRDEFENVTRTLVVKGSSRVFLGTTNWCKTVERAAARLLPGAGTVYLHGCVDDPAHLYLPIETVEEPYREDAQRTALSNARARVTRAIGAATRMVIYGLSLSPADAELGQVLAAGAFNSKLRDIFIVDPKYVEVAERVAVLRNFFGTECRILCVPPSDLTAVWTFTRDGAAAELQRLRER